MEKNYKIETKGSLWEVTLEQGAYSDYEIKFYVFEGNSEEEVWIHVKQWAKEGGIDSTYNYGLIYGEEKYQFADLPGHKSEMEWGTAYGDSYRVKIKRLNVVYVNPTK